MYLLSALLFALSLIIVPDCVAVTPDQVFDDYNYFTLIWDRNNQPFWYFGADKNSVTSLNYGWQTGIYSLWYDIWFPNNIPVNAAYTDKGVTQIVNVGSLDINISRAQIVNILGSCSSIARLTDSSNTPCWYDPSNIIYTDHYETQPPLLVCSTSSHYICSYYANGTCWSSYSDSTSGNCNSYTSNNTYYYITYKVLDANGADFTTYVEWYQNTPSLFVPAVPTPPDPNPPATWGLALQEYVWLMKNRPEQFEKRWNITLPKIGYDFRYKGFQRQYVPNFTILLQVKSMFTAAFFDFQSNFTSMNILKYPDLPDGDSKIDLPVWNGDIKTIDLADYSTVWPKMRIFVRFYSPKEGCNPITAINIR